MNQIERLLEQPWTVVADTSDGEVILTVEEIPEFFSAGCTADEAEANFWEALESHLQSYLELGEDPPVPRPVPGAVFGGGGPEPDHFPVGEGTPPESFEPVVA